jgi:hypothetical protein
MAADLCRSAAPGISSDDGRNESVVVKTEFLMTSMVRRALIPAIAIIAGHAGLVAAPPRPAALTPVTAVFRCPETVDCLMLDRIASDGLGPYQGATSGSEQGPYFDSASNLYFPLQPGLGRFVSLDLSAPLAAPPCAAKSNCRKNFVTALIDDSRPASIVNPLDAAGSALPNGFLSIAVGQSARARYKLNFADPAGRSLLWTVRFNSAMYPGSTELTVTRTAIDTWVVEAGESDVAQLVSTTTSGKAVTINEGYYAMPFRLTVTK